MATTTFNQRLSPETQQKLGFEGSLIANQLALLADELEQIRRADYARTIDHAEFLSCEKSLRQAIDELLSLDSQNQHGRQNPTSSRAKRERVSLVR